MSYVAAVDHLHALGLELASNPSGAAPRRKFDLQHMRVLARALGDPQRQFPAILIAGTNGKGSTAATLASILAAAGYRTGLYTSPHLTRVTERIRTAEPTPKPTPEPRAPHLASEIGEVKPRAPQLASEMSEVTPIRDLPPQIPAFTEIPEQDFARLYFRVDDTARALVSSGELPHHPSFFEALTALAFLYFAERRLDIAILEVGLGGRLDATNIVEPMLSVITDIALDHQEYLGDTLTAIAWEKAGILRANGTLITLPQHPEANQAIGEAAVALNVRGINAADYLPNRDPIPTPECTPESTGAPSITASPSASPSWVGSTAALLATNPVLLKGTALAVPLNHPGDRRALAPEVTPSPSPPLPANHYDLTLDHQPLRVRSPLPGEHQRRNIALAIATAVELRNKENKQISNNIRYNITNSAIEAGIANTSWPGRLEFLPPNLLLDVAHNPAGAWTLRAAIATLPEQQPRTLLFSCLRDKDLREMAQILFPLFDSASHRPHDHLVLAPIDNPRAASLDDLLAAAHALDIPAHAAHSPAEALAIARQLTPAGGLILATGSVYLIGALRELAQAPRETVDPR